MADNQLSPNQRLKFIREKLGYSARAFAESLGILQGSYSDIERGKAMFSSAVMTKLDEIYSINLNWILSGKGDPIIGGLSTPNNAHLKAKNAHLIPQIGQNVTIVPVSAQAGIIGHWTQEWIDQNLVKTSFPGVTSEAYAFEVSGDSMLPTIREGDYVIGRKLERIEDVRESRVHIVISRSSGIYIKRVYIGTECLILESDNTDFQPVSVPNDDIHEIYYAFKRYTDNFSGPRPYSSRIEKIEDYLSKRFPDFQASGYQE
jgi:transcriptional regulator with XRE-family HTH domain